MPPDSPHPKRPRRARQGPAPAASWTVQGSGQDAANRPGPVGGAPPERSAPLVRTTPVNPPGPLAPFAGIPRIDEHPVAVYLSRLDSAGSRRVQRSALVTVAALLGSTIDSLPWWELRYQHVQAIRGKLSETCAIATANRILSAVRGVAEECAKLGRMSFEDFQRIKLVKSIKGETIPKGRGLKSEEIKRILASIDGSTARGVRNYALFATLYGAGLRRSEGARLELKDYEDQALLRVRKGKGKKDRIVQVSPDIAHAIDSWIIVRGTDPGPLFLPCAKGGKLVFRPLSEETIMTVMNELTKAAGIERFTPHDLRRSYVSDLLDLGVDIATVRNLAGHSNVATTARYDRRGEKAKAAAAALITLPT